VSESEPPLRTLAEVAEALGLSLHRVRSAAEALDDRLDVHEGQRGSRNCRLYGPEAVALIDQRVRKTELRRHQAAEEGAAYWQAVAAVRVAANRLFHMVHELDGTFRALRKSVPRRTRFIHSLPHPGLVLVLPLAVEVAPLRRSAWRAGFAEAGLEAKGKGLAGAIEALRRELVKEYLALREDPEQNPQRWAVLQQLIREPLRQQAPAERSGPETAEEADGDIE
jgi:hypothetical protein